MKYTKANTVYKDRCIDIIFDNTKVVSYGPTLLDKKGNILIHICTSDKKGFDRGRTKSWHAALLREVNSR